MSYYNFKAAKRAYEAAPSLPSKQAGTAYKVYRDGAKPGTRMRQKKEGPHMAAHILHVIATHFDHADIPSTFLSASHIAADARTSSRSVKRAVADLVASKHLIMVSPKEKKDRREDDHACSTYFFGPAMETSSVSSDDLPFIELPPNRQKREAVVPASEAAVTLSARFTALLDQAEKPSDRRKTWPETFDRLLTKHDQAETLALLEWVFTVDTFWKKKLRTSTKINPAEYLAQKFDTITTAMKRPASASAPNFPGRRISTGNYTPNANHI